MFCDKNQNTEVPSPSYASEPADLIEKYLNANPKTGYIKFQVYQDSPLYGRRPIANAKITLCEEIGHGFYVCKVITTDMDGNTEPVAVPTVSAELSQKPDNGNTHSAYDISVEAPGFIQSNTYGIPVYEGVTSIQSVVLSPIIPQAQQENLNAEVIRGETVGNH